ncbi:cytochrome P450 [Diplogelasinospora grovesii]|uniref:Cytochrome P450 n=1 Tax=Diplogelasinospora grovesii TaxID=303347 RepID=A0AAN6S311_9PEZI|nr:cytochrome P450 [Diplogelasinospora grovesii]
MALTNINLVVLFAFAWLIFALRYVWWRLFSYQGIPKHLPWAGSNGGLFSRARASYKSFFGLRELLLKGYREHSKAGRNFILPNIVNGHEVIIPTHYMPWLLEQPDNVLSQYETNRQFMCGDYTMLHPDMLGKNWPRLADTVKREMTRDLDDFADVMVDEIQDSLKSLWGSDTEKWHEIVLYDVMLEVVGRVVNRIFVGLPLCRNPGYLQASTGFSKYILLWAMGIELVPQVLKPVIGPILTAYDYLQYRRMAKFVAPIFQDRISRLGPGATLSNMKSDPSRQEPNDYIQWALRDVFRHGENPYDPNDMITKRLAITSFTAIQSSAITITNAVIDIAATPLSVAVQEEIREEVMTAATTEPPSARWSRASLAKLPKLDSVLTETLRLWGILTHGVTKAVVAREGVQLPTGEHIPYGAKVGIASYGPHLDEQVYGPGNPFVFDAFRFLRRKKEGALPGLSFVTTSEYYMGFSHGRHACPGRFFANSLLKVLLAHISLLYEIEPLESRPANPWLNNTIGPPIGAKVRVRRRKVDANTFQKIE